MELQGNMGHVESCFGPFGDSVGVVCKRGAWFAPNVAQAQKSFWTHPMVLLGDKAQVEAQFSPFEYSANLDAR
jgi:hypothetical protein